jgi:ribosomal protein S18 acetylase RimI-like enzyme
MTMFPGGSALIEIHRSDPPHANEVLEFLAENHSARVARRGELHVPGDLPALVAVRDGRLAGVLTFGVQGSDCEIATLHAVERYGGVGTALIDRLIDEVRGTCDRLWLVTTNDNVDALRFYQRRGFVLAALRPSAVDRARAELKPEIPATGNYGIALRDELELERRLADPR